MPRKKLVYVLNHFRSGAIPNIIQEIHPTISKSFDVHVVAIGCINYDDAAFKAFTARGIPVYALDCSRWNLTQTYLRLRRFLAEFQPDIVHGHMGRAEIMTPLCSPRGAATFATYHNVKHGHKITTRVLSRIADLLLDRRTCVSMAVAQSWFGSAANGACVIYNPINSSRFEVRQETVLSIRKEFGLEDDVAMLLSVGRLTAQKGHPILIRAAALLREAGVERFKLVIAGRGEDEDLVRQEIKRWGLETHVVLAGFRDDIPALMAAADLFVLSSFWEGHPLVILEAMAAGLAFVASRLPVLDEMGVEGRMGLLTPPGDDTAMSAGIRRLLIDRSLRLAMSDRAKEFVNKTFGADRIGEQYLALYTNAVGLQRGKDAAYLGSGDKAVTLGINRE